MVTGIREIHEQRELVNEPSVLLVTDTLRDFLARFVRPAINGLHVLAFSEIPADVSLRIVASVGDPALAAPGEA